LATASGIAIGPTLGGLLFKVKSYSNVITLHASFAII